VAVRYYRERAVPYLVRFPTRVMPETSEPLPEGLASWDPGSPVEDIDWLGTVITSPKIVPGFTTMQRVWGTTEGSLPSRQPVDLDIYVDCSGSMPNPQQLISYLALAGAILIISALRAGARVQATLWSGGHQYDTSHGFIRDETQLLRILTGYLGNGTAFPIHLLRDTYAGRKPEDRPVHIVVISDDGFSTMYDKDEKGNSGKDIADMALKNCRGGGSLVLNMFRSGYYAPLLTLAEAQGWRVHLIQSWDELLTFAHEFSRAAYGDAAGAPPDEGVNPYGGN